jgi:tetratricopeptide (TPR) repeat protein
MRSWIVALLLCCVAFQASAQQPKSSYETEKELISGASRSPGSYPDKDYQEAWKQYSLGYFDEAMKAMTSVFTSAQSDPSKSALANDALLDLAFFYSLSKPPEGAKTFFLIAKDKLPTALLLIARSYSVQGKFANAISMFRELIALDPKSNKNFFYQYELCLSSFALNSLGDKQGDKTITEIKALLVLYQDLTSRGAPKEIIAEARALSSKLVREAAVNLHSEGQKTKGKDPYRRAETLYREYEKNFPDAEDIYQMTWNHAELTFQLGELGDDTKWAEAGDLYRKVINLEPNGKHFDEAMKAMVSAYQNVPMSGAYQAISGISADAPRKLSDEEKKLIDAYQLYLEKSPSGDKAPNSIFAIGVIYCGANLLDDAAKAFQLIVEKHTNSEFAVYSANFLLDIYITQKKIDVLLTLCDKISKILSSLRIRLCLSELWVSS